MIKGYCFTNLDEYKQENWPEVFCTVPRAGEWVQAESGKVLTVVKVTHENRLQKTTIGEMIKVPRIRVELHK